jgi:small conductance mechanosensitive channel
MEYIKKYTDMIVLYLPNFILALMVLVIGWWLIARVAKYFSLGMAKQEIDVSLRTFLASLVKIILQVLLVISVASMLGIQTTSFVAVLGAAGLAVGLALQGSLANFAGGVLILIFRPFKVGDYIEAMGKAGQVKEIQIFCTILTTPEGKNIIMPNGALSNGLIVNSSAEGMLFVNIKVDLANTNDIKKVREVALKLMQADARVLPQPSPEVGIAKLSPGSMSIEIKCFTKPEDNVAFSGDLIEQIKDAFAEHKFTEPESHTFVHNISVSS